MAILVVLLCATLCVMLLGRELDPALPDEPVWERQRVAGKIEHDADRAPIEGDGIIAEVIDPLDPVAQAEQALASCA